MPLCRYFTAVLKCKADIIPGVDRYEVNQSAPKVHIEFLYQAVLCRQGFQEGFYFCLSSLLVGDGCGDLIVPSLGSIVESLKTITAEDIKAVDVSDYLKNKPHIGFGWNDK